MRATEASADVVAGSAVVEQLAEHFHTGTRGLLRVADTNDFDLVVTVYDALLNLAGDYSATTGDREDVLDRHQEWLVDVALWLWDVSSHAP